MHTHGWTRTHAHTLTRTPTHKKRAGSFRAFHNMERQVPARHAGRGGVGWQPSMRTARVVIAWHAGLSMLVGLSMKELLKCYS